MQWGIPRHASVLVGGQFGSEGKGLAAAWLADQTGHVDIATTNAGAQAGHTTKYADGTGFVCFHLPTTAVAKQRLPVRTVYDSRTKMNSTIAYINGGSIIDIDALEKEIADCGIPPHLVKIHPRAAVISAGHKLREQDTNAGPSKIASTQKGVGAALSDKIMRRAETAQSFLRLAPMIENIGLNDKISRGEAVVVEIPQGTDLSINHGLSYPYCTSRDCWVGSGLDAAGIHPCFVGPVCMVVRTYPIRVGHLYNEMGETIGTSGPFYADGPELDWEKDFPTVEPERTTVTKRVRRIASWSNMQYRRSLALNRPTIVFLNFCNYLSSPGELLGLAYRMDFEHKAVGLRVRMAYGFGPCVEDVTDDFDRAVSWFDKRSF